MKSQKQKLKTLSPPEMLINNQYYDASIEDRFLKSYLLHLLLFVSLLVQSNFGAKLEHYP